MPSILDRLIFLRWLADQGRLEHRVEGAPSGPLTDDEPPRAEGAA